MDDGTLLLPKLVPFQSTFSHTHKICFLFQDINEKFEIADKIDKYLIPFKRWNLNYEQSPESLMRMYHVIAIIILHCSEIVYNRVNESTFVY